MKITKMHGLGNDFILTESAADDWAAAAKKLCERRLNVGADGLIVAAPSGVADIKMRIFNADGSEAEMCGNGIRCFARYVYDRGIVKTQSLTVETLAGVVRPRLILENDAVIGVRVDMGKPDFTPANIPVLTDTPLAFEAEAGGERFICSSVLVGVPHTVVFRENPDDAEVGLIGPRIETHPLFPRRTNVNFAQILDRGAVRVKTWERGVGRTLACGTGSAAVGVVAHKKGLADATVKILLDAGELMIETMPDGAVFMTGPADYVFEGDTI